MMLKSDIQASKHKKGNGCKSREGRHVMIAITWILHLCWCQNEEAGAVNYSAATTTPGVGFETSPEPFCGEIVCKLQKANYQINASLCRGWSSLFTVQPWKPSSTVSIWMDAHESRESFLCVWRITVPLRHLTVVEHGYPLLAIILRGVHAVKATKTRPGEPIGQSLLHAKPISLFWFEQTFVFSYFGNLPLRWVSRTLLNLRTARSVQLPSGLLSQTAFYVTSPNFGTGPYPHNYYGEYVVSVPDHHSVLIRFISFHLQAVGCCLTCSRNACVDELIIIELHQATGTSRRRRSECGRLLIPDQTFRHSLVLQFYSNKQFSEVGFKLTYSVVSTADEPKRIEGELLNCSSPFYFKAQALFRCNLVTDCQGSEDEEGCDMYREVCGVGGVELGHKCLYVYALRSNSTWQQAQYECTRKRKRLLTFSTSEYQRTLQWIKTNFNIFRFFLGLQLTKKHLSMPFSALYQDIWQWTDSRTAFVAIQSEDNIKDIPMCAYYSDGLILADPCDERRTVHLICDVDKPDMNSTASEAFHNVSTETWHAALYNLSLASCQQSHLTRDFLLCNGQNHCDMNNVQTCSVTTGDLLMFPCDYGANSVPYSLVCDYITHCKDGSDEDFCYFKPCPLHLFRCRNGQCIENKRACDRTLHCFDKSDEDSCSLTINYFQGDISLPAVFTLAGRGTFFTNDSHVCPATHFRCPGGYCFPVYLRCNSVDDCPGREDEIACGSHTCPGYYRCRESSVCVHVEHVCDGVFQCPQYDDELLCQERTCPDGCRCQGLAVVCKGQFSASWYSGLRYLDIRSTAMTAESLTQNWYLVTLRLSNTGLTEVPKLALPNLKHLDLSSNGITLCNMQQFRFLVNLRVLILKGNPIQIIINKAMSRTDFMKLHSTSFLFKTYRPFEDLPISSIDLSHTNFRCYNGSAFINTPKLKTLNMSWSKVHTVVESGFTTTRMLEIIDLRGSPVDTFPKDLLRNLAFLQAIFANSFKLCCKAMLPEDFNANKCYAEQDALASCDDLLRSNAYRVFMWVFLFLSLAGNGGSFVGRLYLSSSETSTSSFSIFVTHLCVSDFLMGIYLLIVGVADLVYLGEYLWHDDQWKSSSACSLAGLLSLMSNEVSAFIICLITVDRFLVLSFPFSSLHFGKWSSTVACLLIWLLGMGLASFPLVPMVSHWQYYSQTSICIPLPFATGDQFEGRVYSMTVMIIINCVLFMLIALGQILIYRSVQKNSMQSFKNQGTKDIVIARRLMTVVVSDFLCWFPVGLLGLLSATGVQISRELNVGVAVFVLPFNSAMNPFLYTLNVLKEKRQKRKEERLLKRLQAQGFKL